MGKNIKDLERSRAFRETVIKKYGCVPTTIWDLDYSLNDMVDDIETTQAKVMEERHRWLDYDKSDKELSKAFSTSGRSVRGEGGGLSIFPYDLARRIIRFYSEPGETILDPCSGHATRMTACFNEGRNYVGYDVSTRFMKHNRRVRKNLLGLGSQTLLCEPETTITLHFQSSEHMVEPDNFADLIFTSPPYWDIEFYGNEVEQLGRGKTYNKFLMGLKDIISECHRVLKPGKFCAFNINDFRKDHKLYLYHIDVANLMEEVGFNLWDCIIIRWVNAIGQAFASQVEERKITAKQHEYLIVGRKSDIIQGDGFKPEVKE